MCIIQKVNTRRAAKEQGLIHYFTGRPCRKGHVAERLTSNGSCIICHAEGNKNRTYDYQKQHPFEAMFYRRKNAAKHEGILFTIKIKELIVPSVCPVLGILLQHGRENLDSSPSMDRVVPDKGYIPGNVKIISLRANRIKSDGTVEEHLKIIEYMKEHKQSD